MTCISLNYVVDLQLDDLSVLMAAHWSEVYSFVK